MKIRALAPIALLFSIWSGCGNDDGGSDGGGATPADCAGAARQLCAKFQGCFPVAFQGTYGNTTERCEIGLKQSCEAATNAPGSKTTFSNVSACISASLSSCDTLTSTGTRPEACKSIPGDLAEGAACYSGAQCAGNRCVVETADATCGKCSAFAKEGADCSAPTSRCDEGLHCDGKVCVKDGLEGSACKGSNECGDNLACSGDKCVQIKKLKKGEPCSLLEITSQCDTIGGQLCTPKTENDVDGECKDFKLVAAGAACGIIDGVVTLCEAGGDCDKTSKKCVAAIKDGETCDPAGDVGCLEPAECSKANKCELPSVPTCK